MFWDMREFDCPMGRFEDLQARGFHVRLSARTPLGDTEKSAIRNALIQLAQEGAPLLGRYKYVGNWVARKILFGTRTPVQAASFIRLILRDEHSKSVAAGRTTHPLPPVSDLSGYEPTGDEPEGSGEGVGDVGELMDD